jgi:spermidine synthase
MTSTWNPQQRSMMLPAFLVSLAVLAQELLLVRLLAVGLWHHITYMVVTMALLAFGFAGTLLSVFPRLAGKPDGDGRAAFTVYAMLFGAMTFVSGQAIGRADIDTWKVFSDQTTILDLFGGIGGQLLQLYLLVALPILFGGLAIVVALQKARQGLAKTYFANLLGSGAGCVAFLLLLTPLGGPKLLLLTAALGMLAGWVAKRNVWTTVIGSLLLGVCLAGLVSDTALEVLLPKIKPVPSKVLHEYVEEKGHVLKGEPIWDPLCRVEVTHDPRDPNGRHTVFQDGDAPTFIEPAGFPPSAETLVPYILHPELQSLCIIGAGGGRELALAANRGVTRVVGVEINKATVSLLNGPYRAFTGNLVDHPAVKLVNDEGRAYLARNDEKFDYIQMTGVDTYAALNSGAYVNSESYLYTLDAFDDFLGHLNPGGYFSIIRYYFKEQPRETLRLFVTAIQALKNRGVSEPWRHVMVLGPIGQWGILVVSIDPVTEETMARVRKQMVSIRTMHQEASLVHDPLLSGTLSNPFNEYVNAFREGKGADMISKYPLNITPVTDDSPFLYLYWKWGEVLKRLVGIEKTTSSAVANPGMTNMGQMPVGAMVILSLLLQCTLVGVLLVLGPLLLFRARALVIPGRMRVITFFACLGLGFMLLEIALAQRFALFLGHPTLSLSVVIGGILVFSGIGCLISSKLDAQKAVAVSTLVVALLVLGLTLFLGQLTGTWLKAEESVRILTALLVLAPVSIFLGMPMASGLRVLDQRGPDLVPWAWGVNGVASVIGSILAILLAETIGFTAVLLIAGSLYVLAFLLRPRIAA